MQKFEGIHFYVNVANFNEVVIDEETKNGKVNHAIHALDTFFSGIESFGKKNFSEKFVIEKITGARLHMYVVDDVNEAYEIVEEVVKFAGDLSRYLDNDIAKYKTLLEFKIQAGACFGSFYSFEFKRQNANEETTIGYAANYAAKLQGLCNMGDIAVSSNIFDTFNTEKKNKYVKHTSSKVQKYGEDCYYEMPISKLTGSIDYSESLIASKDYANNGKYLFCVGVPQSFIHLKNVLLENVRTAESMMIAYESYQRGITKKVNLIAYSHGEKGKNEYNRNRKQYRTM